MTAAVVSGYSVFHETTLNHSNKENKDECVDEQIMAGVASNPYS